MGIEGQFLGLTTRTRTELALAGAGRRKGYLYDIRRFPMLERDQEYRLAKRWREQATAMRRTSSSQVTSGFPPRLQWVIAATVCPSRK